jgi:hypothetical protein
MARSARASVRSLRIVCAHFRRRFALSLGLGVLLFAADALAQPLPTRLSELLALRPDRLLQSLISGRPEPVPQTVRQAAQRMLPNHGEITDLSPRSAASLRSLSRVLRAADRERVYVLKVVDVPQAAAGNHLRSVLVITGPALELLAADELQAIVAHELAHEYVWRDYEDASTRRDDERLKELELVCDAVAVLILRKAGVDGAVLPRALERISRYNDVRFGRAMNASSYPALEKRTELVGAVTAALASTQQP